MTGEEFAARVAALGLSQSAMGRCLGVPQVRVSRMMSGASPVPDGISGFVRDLESRVRECVRLEAKNLREYGNPQHEMVHGWLADPELSLRYDAALDGAGLDAVKAVVRGRAYGEVDGDEVPAGSVL